MKIYIILAIVIIIVLYVLIVNNIIIKYANRVKEAFSNMDAEDALKEAQTFVDGISEVNKLTLDTAKAAWEKEALENTPNPGGGKSGGEPEKKSEASEYAKAYSAKMCPENKPADDNAPVNI